MQVSGVAIECPADYDCSLLLAFATLQVTVHVLRVAHVLLYDGQYPAEFAT